MRILVVTSREHSKSNRGIDVITEHFSEVGHEVYVYVYPVSYSNKRVIKDKKKNHIYAKYTPVNYYEKLMKNFPVFISRFIFKMLFRYTNTVDFSEYDLIVIESGYAVSLVDYIPKNLNVIYRQSDSLELILTKNKYLIECERKLIDYSHIALIPNEKIMNYYKNIGFNNLVLWENGFRKSEDIKMKNLKKHSNTTCVYMGLFPVDLNLLKKLAEAHNDVEFHIVGPHEKKLNMHNVHFHGYMQYLDYINLLRNASFTILPLKNSSKLKYVGQTSKIYQFMDCRKPIITIDYGFISEFAIRTKNIHVCNGFEDFNKAIHKVKIDDFKYYDDIDISNYYIENRKKELEIIFKKGAIV